ncbi:hypothetical protein CLAIMM_15187 isoform 1, partial [Cladophialophora immunda]
YAVYRAYNRKLLSHPQFPPEAKLLKWSGEGRSFRTHRVPGLWLDVTFGGITPILVFMALPQILLFRSSPQTKNKDTPPKELPHSEPDQRDELCGSRVTKGNGVRKRILCDQGKLEAKELRTQPRDLANC